MRITILNIIKHINFLFILIGIIGMSSCSDFLYQEPDQEVSFDEIFNSKKNLLAAVNGVYEMGEEVVSGIYFVYADMQGGNITFAPNSQDVITAKSSLSQVYPFEDTEEESDYEYFYSYSYSCINAANIIIERIDEVPDISEDEENEIVAEMLSTRAYFHFIISQLYSQNYNYSGDGSHLGIVYNTSTIRAGVDFPSRKTVKETYALLKADIENALVLYTDSQALSYGMDYSYFNKVNTEALMARIALHFNDWETASAYADSTIKNADVVLMTKDNYVSEWEKESDPVCEVLFEFTAPFDIDDDEVTSSVANSFFGYEYLTTTNSSTNTIDTTDIDFVTSALVASHDLLDLYTDEDVRGLLFESIKLEVKEGDLETQETFYFTNKFQGKPGATVMRLSELYLINAEAKYRISEANIDLALSDLNIIRERAGLSPLENDASLDFLEEVFLERRRELAFEGHLVFDLMRYEKPIDRQQDCVSSSCYLSYPNARFILPIPENSIEHNANMKQNYDY